LVKTSAKWHMLFFPLPPPPASSNTGCWQPKPIGTQGPRSYAATPFLMRYIITLPWPGGLEVIPSTCRLHVVQSCMPCYHWK
jgi:hypothetical protein